MKARKTIGLLFGLIFLSTAMAFSAETEIRYNLLIFLVNCLNKNHLAMNGYSRQTTPNLDRFSRSAYIFKNMVSPATFTPPVLQELFSGAPLDRTFYSGRGWSDWFLPKLTDFPLGRFLVEQGYEYLHEELPEVADRPFISFLNVTNLHFPYDPDRRRGHSLVGTQQRFYRDILAGIDTIKLVKQLSDYDGFPAQLDYLAFSTRRTEIPIDDMQVWDALLKSLKESGDSPAAVIASGLPISLTRRLAQIQSAQQLSLKDKAAVVRALNQLIKSPESPIGRVIFGPQTYFINGNLFFCGRELNWEDQLFAFNVNRQLRSPEPFLIRSVNRLMLLNPLHRDQLLLLRQTYREALEYILPALAFNRPQSTFMGPHPEMLKKWQNSPRFMKELSLLKVLYDAELLDVDKRFSESLDHLRRLGVLDKTIVVFMGDHGEAFMEHGYMEHVYAGCYNEVVNPPLLIHVPGRLKETMVVETLLRTADILPTLVDLMGFRLPPGIVGAPAGISLAHMLDGGSAPDITAFSRNYFTSRSVRNNNGWKYLMELGTDRRELYNVKLDSMEKRNVAMDFPQIMAELEEKLNRFLYGD